MANTIAVLGVGPGSADYLTPAAARHISEAEVLVGACRLIKTFAQPGQKCYTITADLQQTIRVIKEESRRHKVAVLVSGDSGLYSFASCLTKHIDGKQLEIIPGISPVQLLFARIKKPWQQAVIISMHGRTSGELIELVKRGRLVAVLTDKNNTPQAIARWLLSSGCPDAGVTVGCNLSYDDERIYSGTLSQLCRCNDRLNNSVMVIGDA
ncbi:cobalt-precorrin-7 (C5)-methyltransferase [Desulfohalotomaculum tongense]|uniref:precorrin-6y C5,15-methyltransferase (decarboxylating) subunit CbiE n=1 Tax=Desulforadius tongensis TaxID=1216062 RepID=UPI001959AD49|nr:precorrin-6y C5,15-methyltransferase (decarboxylating) subunit CbiE [Desulforadius tongensis]MBM7854344.1 cobalt-precorrin-7 (C5)-methyltransferase [Desulforadius tongensis]